MRIGYFGGSFDPPHRGHLAVARAVRDRFAPDRLLLAPTGRQPLKAEGARASFPDRLRMTELLCAEEPGLEASDADGPLPDGSPNYTVDTLRRLRQGLPDAAELFAILGADAFLSIPQWRQAAELFELAEWIVVSRPGVASQEIRAVPLTPEQRRRTHILEGVAEPVSATDLRGRLEAGLPCEELLPDSVLRYIREHGLYRASIAEER
jgi:nicotinate-nucleotide adenylyltransferase